MVSAPGQPPVLVSVPNLLGLSADTARDFAHRSQLLAVGPDPDAVLPGTGTVLRQQPHPHTMVPRWSTVVIWTDTGPGDAGVREPRRPNPPPLSVQLHAAEPTPDLGPPAEPAQNSADDGSGAPVP